MTRRAETPAKTPGQIAYEADVAKRPLYDCDGTPRRTWEQISDFARSSWETGSHPKPDRRKEVAKETGYVTTTTCAEYFHRARAALSAREAK